MSKWLQKLNVEHLLTTGVFPVNIGKIYFISFFRQKKGQVALPSIELPLLYRALMRNLSGKIALKAKDQ